MWRSAIGVGLGVALAGAVLASAVVAQHSPIAGPGHEPVPAQGPDMHAQPAHGTHGMAGGTPTMPGQDAFGAIAEVVRILDADPATDWSKVDLERLRQHLIDMTEVVLRSTVKQTAVAGGLAMEITGSARTEQAIRAMVVPHAAELDRMPPFVAKADRIAGGVRLTVTAATPDDPGAVARVRGLGFIGLLVQGEHHGPHHLAMARGEVIAGHQH